MRELLICDALTTRHPTLPAALDAASVSYQVRSGLNGCVRWRDDSRETVATVLEAEECMRVMRLGTLADYVSARAAPGSILILVGSVAGIEQCASWLSLELGVSVRRAANAGDLATVLCACATVLGRSAPSANEDFLHGLTAADALYNRTKPRDPEATWLGALRQILSENEAAAVHAAYPSFRDLFDHLRAAPDNCKALENIRVGQKRFGPKKAERIRHVLMGTREEAMDEP